MDKTGKKLWSEPSVTEVLVSMTESRPSGVPPIDPPGKSCLIEMDGLNLAGQSNCYS